MKVNVTGKMKQIVTATKHANNILQTYKIIHVLRFLVMPLFKWERALITIIKTRKGAIDFKAVRNKIHRRLMAYAFGIKIPRTAR